MAVEGALHSLSEGWATLKDKMGVVIGMEGKTGRSISINQRIYMDFLKRLLLEYRSLFPLSEIDFSRIQEKLFRTISQHIPSGPYTLPGLMPNVAGGRVTSIFDLQGANMVIDSGGNSLFDAFSYLGNDGQPDYGAANETMNRIAADMAAAGTEGEWSTLAWLGWAGIGMTRGSEYFVLAKSRGLHAVTKEEGKAIFSSFLNGNPYSPVNILMTKGEISYYGAEIVVPPGDLSQESIPSKYEQKDSLNINWSLSLEKDPYLMHHLVNEAPTLPGTFETELAAQAAKTIRPDKDVVMMEKSNFIRFVKVFGGREILLRGKASILSESENETQVHVQLLSDFIHKSGMVLQKDILHFEATVTLTARVNPLPNCYSEWDGRGIKVHDPYLLSGSPVKLSGFFRCLTDIEIGKKGRRAVFKLQDTKHLSRISHFVTPAVLIDGLCRFASIYVTPIGAMPIYVPVSCGRLQIRPGINDFTLNQLQTDIIFSSVSPRLEGDFIYNEWAQASDSTGRSLLIVENLVAQRFGEVHAG